jgi:hypothetical protein
MVITSRYQDDKLLSRVFEIIGANSSDDVVVGLVSWGFGCGLGVPSVYANVAVSNHPSRPSPFYEA